MDETTYRKWSELHLRAASGEVLSPEERAFYERILKELDDTEFFPGDIAELRKTRKRLAELKAAHDELQAKSDALDARIAELEASLSERTRQALNAED
jgi:chromosome segregation ATPase